MRKINKRYHWLAHIINNHAFRVGAEIGAATGITTGYVMKHCPWIEELIVVDDWRPIPNSGQWEMENMKDIFLSKFKGENRVRILEGLSWEMAEAVPGNSLDFVFVDASHDKESVKKDLLAWIPKVKETGMICGHDLHFSGVVEALNEVLPGYLRAGIDNCWFIMKSEIK